ncbi:bifunctional tetrahydrofolate synthase/dihydrofolate synthase [Legionella sp. PATHC032]|uniref:bifunctional tetrahydrofolate synthase/dihydrofolate synthase n=1 Tax=Legionella sp. PATHC032 TaxID=2992039 RepID=UPI001B2490A5|nr:bifunctional tetrahydrofolate synthase/dihydrofolate synthase [Legionella sp. PATHC032]MCW8421218.1 bifunctional tetrahydrofolate synthase/dihydrofolate synthase [Legionella sp. PATHC032]HAZ7574436.1 bifunctional tetrahydrofolate synthase/dihydrofolate synthase [Legionella pneumophila]HBA1635774.1 bifunctional tetrahydrofolate synthase/dihydrofolate synthase [Legionella pneumophila]
MHAPWSEWDLNHWLTHLETRNTQEIQLGLARVLTVAQKLNLQRPNCKVVTVAGTNGKGSTVTALETIYHQSGFKVGAYTSPHLLVFNERIRINLTPIQDKDLCKAFSVIEEARYPTNLTYFEMATLAALWYFKQHDLDLIILEVGLGGRLDATNIVDTDLAIITTIDFDHQSFLGETLELIGYEKAGILRKNKPFIYADLSPPKSVVEVATQLRASSYLYGKDYFYQEADDHWEVTCMGKQFDQLTKPKIQLQSAAAAIMACHLLQEHFPVSYDNLKKAMALVYIPGRLQLQKGKTNILYDVSHNPQSVRLLADTVKKINTKGRVHAVFSALKDKDICGLIMPLKDCVSRWYPAQLHNKRAVSQEKLLSIFREAEIFAEVCYNDPLTAFEMALKQASDGDLIIVYGSFFTVSHVMAAQHNLLEQKENQ